MIAELAAYMVPPWPKPKSQMALCLVVTGNLEKRTASYGRSSKKPSGMVAQWKASTPWSIVMFIQLQTE